MRYPVKSKPDYPFLMVILMIVAIGIIMIFSSSSSTSLHYFGSSTFFIQKHFLFLVMGSVAFYFGFTVPYQLWFRWSVWILVGSIFCLLLTYLPHFGHNAGGASRWLHLGFFTFQPSEVAKFGVILYLSTVLTNFKDRVKSIQPFIPPLILIAVTMGLVLKQPDLGTTLVIVFVTAILLFVGGFPLWFIGGTGFTGVVGGMLYIQKNAYQLKRIHAFLDPWADPHGIGFHTIQSLIGVGNGGLFGMGLGNSRQKFFYLPQQYTDFIFSILCEEFGFIFTCSVIVLFFAMTFLGYRIASQMSDQFGRLLVIGLTSWISVQAFMNMGVVLTLLPATGIPLPFISYGGTSVMMLLLIVGIIGNVSKYRGS